MAILSNIPEKKGLDTTNNKILRVADVRYHAQGKALLSGLSFECKTGALVGILGPSGSGKSVLLDVLTFSAKQPVDPPFLKKKNPNGVQPRNLLQASISFGPESENPCCNINDIKSFSEICAYVPGVDCQYPTLTCRQVLTHTARILCGDGDTIEDIEERVNCLMEVLGLTKCADTIVGGYVGMKGMSGGQKKRLSIGVALLKQPKVLYVDEPTSGLDAAAAFYVMKVIQDLAKKFDLCAICSLQQPPSSVFSMLDTVLILTNGCTAFCGDRHMMLEYFENLPINPDGKGGCIKKKCPLTSNPADWVLNLVNPGRAEGREFVKRLELAGGWRALQAATTPTTNAIDPTKKDTADAENTPGDSSTADEKEGAVSKSEIQIQTIDSKKNSIDVCITPEFYGGETDNLTEEIYERALKAIGRKSASTTKTRIQALFSREFRVAITDPVLYLMRPIIMLVTNIFMLILWWEGRDHDNKYVMSKVWPLFMIMTSNSIYSIVTVFFFKQVFPITCQEVRNGYYQTWEYLLAIVTLSIPIHFIMAAISLYGSIYLIGGWFLEASFYGLITQFILIQIFDACGRACAMSGPLVLGFGSMIQFWYASFLFCGVFLDPDSVPYPFRFFTYISPHRHAVAIFLYTDFEKEDSWLNAEYCAAGTSGTIAGFGCKFPNGTNNSGYRCPNAGVENFQCWGYTGQQVLTSLSQYYPAIDDTNEVVPRLFALIGIAVVFIATHGALLLRAIYSSGKVEKGSFDVENVIAIVTDKTVTTKGQLSTTNDETVKMLDNDTIENTANESNASSSHKSLTPKSPDDDKIAEFKEKSRNRAEKGVFTKFDEQNPNRFECSHLSVWIKKSKDNVKLVNDVNVRVSGGQIFAMLGPSGAGKTTWLDAVTFNLASNLEMSGEGVYVNGKSVSTLSELMNTNDCVYVPQYISLIPTLTCRQNMEVTCQLLMRESKPGQIKEKVDKMLNSMGLWDCQNEKAGGILGNQGLTPGQKKRLSVACGLLKSPSIVLLDEPTTGIDSASASLMMYYLSEIAKNENMTVVCTIHQPSNEIWNLFDQVGIMSSGKIAAVGSRVEVEKHFQSIGFGTPELTNPAEHFLDLVNGDFSSKEKVESILEKWESSEIGKNHRTITLGEYDRVPKLHVWEATDVNDGKDKSLSQQLKLIAPSNLAILKTLLWREVKVAVLSDPTPYVGRFFLYLFSSLFFDIAYAGHFEWSQENVMFKAWLLGWIFCAQTLFSASVTVFYNMAFKLVKGEIRNGYYSPYAYLLSVSLLSIPMSILLAATVIFIPAYLAGNMYWNAGNVILTLINLSVYYLAYENFAQFASVVSDNLLVGLLLVIIYWYNTFLLSGLMINIDEVIQPFRFFTNFMPTRWGLANQMYIEFSWDEDRTLPGATSCAPATSVVDATTKQDTLGCNYPFGINKEGYTCGVTQEERKTCFARTGDEALLKFNSLAFKTFEPENNVWKFIAIVFGLGVLNKINHVFFFVKKVKQSAKLGKIRHE